MIRKSVTPKTELSALDEFMLNTKYLIRRMAGSKVQWYGLDTSSLIVENVPLITGGGERHPPPDPAQGSKSAREKSPSPFAEKEGRFFHVTRAAVGPGCPRFSS